MAVVHFTHLIPTWINIDMRARPTPLPATRTTSTAARFRLKYWPSIRVAGSRVRPTPMPANINGHACHYRDARLV